MCLAMLIESSPTEKMLEQILLSGERDNPDGIGIAWRAKGLVNFKKGIEMDELMDIMYAQKPPYLVHFRLASAGGKSKALCHPFPVRKEYNLELQGTADAVIIHNGHVPNWEATAFRVFTSSDSKMPHGPWSDTRFMAYLAARNGRQILTFLNEKVAYMSRTEVDIYSKYAWTRYETGKKSAIWCSYDVLERDKRREELARGMGVWHTGIPSMMSSDEDLVDIEFTPDSNMDPKMAMAYFDTMKRNGMLPDDKDRSWIADKARDANQHKLKQSLKLIEDKQKLGEISSADAELLAEAQRLSETKTEIEDLI